MTDEVPVAVGPFTIRIPEDCNPDHTKVLDASGREVCNIIKVAVTLTCDELDVAFTVAAGADIVVPEGAYSVILQEHMKGKELT